MKKTTHNVLLAALLALVSGQSVAAVKDDALAHFNAIADGKTADLKQQYAQDARLDWIGGPLDGTYTSSDAIGGVWSKFITAQGKLSHKVDNLNEVTNPKGSTVTARVQFAGKTTINVFYVLTYREGKIVNETWQIDPAKG
ncbi:nuclear transport factor 2 family protein [Enterobacter chuandaensis]|uniref:nuclear transport factor 2 family protein n=1 Tax=Enterobacter TaxID=547 RepID=UPI0013D56BDE|nr:nuclear transport factor 2 family protein [Enterobacter sp. 296B2]ELG9999292.1 nuclear transport factor 2 family protein [Enterobacter cloacae]